MTKYIIIQLCDFGFPELNRTFGFRLTGIFKTNSENNWNWIQFRSVRKSVIFGFQFISENNRVFILFTNFLVTLGYFQVFRLSSVLVIFYFSDMTWKIHIYQQTKHIQQNQHIYCSFFRNQRKISNILNLWIYNVQQ